MKKTISLSALLIVAFPVLAFGQQVTPPDSTQKSDSYYAQVPFQVAEGTPNHITGAQLDPTRSASKQARLAKATNELLSAHLSAAQALQNIRTIQQNEIVAPVANQVSGNEIKVTEQVIEPPTVAPQQFVAPDVSVPTPANSKSETRFRQVAPAEISTQFVERPEAAMVDPMSIEQFQQRGRVEPWVEKQSRMRNVGDFFSPGGRPFAFQTFTGNPNFFGVDRHQCCDEWEQHCNCGGLKVNPGHLGLRWLRSRENCDQADSIGNRRGCGCDQCNR